MKKDELIDSVFEAIKEYGTATTFFHMAMAETMGLCPSDIKALDLIRRKGGLTAGELGTHTGLASASVTSLIDRLEKHGYVNRVRGKRDRRRIKVEAVPEKIDVIYSQILPLKSKTRDRLGRFNADELETIRNFLKDSSELLREGSKRLNPNAEKLLGANCG